MNLLSFRPLVSFPLCRSYLLMPESPPATATIPLSFLLYLFFSCLPLVCFLDIYFVYVLVLVAFLPLFRFVSFSLCCRFLRGWLCVHSFYSDTRGHPVDPNSVRIFFLLSDKYSVVAGCNKLDK